MDFFRAEDIVQTFSSGETALTILSGVSLTLQPGEMSGIIGASGSGKTTLLQILGTLATPSSGSLHFNGDSLFSKSSEELAAFRNRSIGFIFQFHHLLADFTALENVMMPGLIAGNRPKAVRPKAEELLEQVGLSQRMSHRISELSGGEQQRTALARALVNEPEILLADEPTGNLDIRAGEQVFNLLHSMCRERKLSTLMVTHNLELAGRMDRCYTLRDGKLFPGN